MTPQNWTSVKNILNPTENDFCLLIHIKLEKQLLLMPVFDSVILKAPYFLELCPIFVDPTHQLEL